ncbi:hypothetical protein JTE90_002149 [Oedothorax gibbosus]|uniref:Uncharacterized protein n=1 Tax=Oedothorax gibbosus TaxID=931172 RepID=A0AAV6V6J3_9ARAC|nr:hypothetical protein JTE90_002149 [Oedothorax gibbosus]
MTRFSISALFILSVCLTAHLVTSHGHHHDHGHDHSHHDHDHGHVHEPPSFKYSKQANQEHQHSSSPKIAKPSRGTLTLWVEALGSTLLISAAPFVILFFIPISNKAEHQPLLKVLLSFASGGLLGDAFLHLIPHALLANSASSDGSHSHSHSHSHNSEEGSHGHDLSVGLGVLGGIVVFLMVEKFVRIVKGDHGHSHGRPSKEPSVEKDKEVGKDCETKGDEREREEDPCEDAAKEKTEDEPLVPKSEIADHGPDGDIMVAGYLNLAADFMHNFTDGLAIGASYIAGSGIGLITTMTILLHEVPHEIGDFAILIQSGCSKGRAIGLQLVTAIGALAGTAVSLFAEGMDSRATNLILPFTAGGFIYIATVSVIPDLLEDTNFWQSVKEVIALLVGVFMMVLIAQYE